MKYGILSWQGKTFPAKIITLFQGTDREEEVMISVTDLENRLIDSKGQCISGEAMDIDNRITYYLTLDEFTSSEENVISIVENALQ